MNPNTIVMIINLALFFFPAFMSRYIPTLEMVLKTRDYWRRCASNLQKVSFISRLPVWNPMVATVGKLAIHPITIEP